MMISRAAGENQDATTEKGEYYLTDEEEMLLQCLSVSFEKVIVILNVGYPISMEFVDKYRIKGLVYCGFGGMLGGQALLDVLTGKENPSGKLPDTWALDYFDHPSSKNFYDANGKARLNADSSEYGQSWVNKGSANDFLSMEALEKSWKSTTSNGYWGLAAANHDDETITVSMKYYAYGQHKGRRKHASLQINL